MEKQVKIGIIGTGSMGGSHVNSVYELPNTCLTAICDIDPAKFDRFRPEIREKVDKFTSSKEFFAKAGLEDENDDVIILDSNEIDLQDIIVQALSCALPITSLCSEDCKGFCPECGCNLNIETCNCEVDDIDPRLAVLKDFLK